MMDKRRLALRISVGLVKIGSPPWGERFPPAGANSNAKTASRKYQVEPAPIPKATKTQRRRNLTFRPNRWAAPQRGALMFRLFLAAGVRV